MEIEIPAPAVKTISGIALAVLILLAALVWFGRSLTPVRNGEAGLLTWEEWQILKVQQAYEKELADLQSMIQELAVLTAAKADPVRGQVLAGRVIEKLAKGGLPALETPRRAILAAAEAVREWSMGTGTSGSAITLLDGARQALQNTEVAP